jgi:hypothetical protein
MENKEQIVEQCRLAFIFVQKLYMEVSYFIKEVEGLLLEEGFVIGKPSGYQISSRGSSGLEPYGVNMWLLKKLAVFFAPDDKIKLDRGQTTLSVERPAEVVYLRIVLHDDKLAEPTVYAGVLYDVQRCPNTKWPSKFEQAMQHIEYNDTKIFKGDMQHLDYRDRRIMFKGHLLSIPLFEVNDSDTILGSIVRPCLALYEEHGVD